MSTARSRPAWFYLLLVLYGVGALGMAALVADPSSAVDPATEPSQLIWIRAAFAVAGALCALIVVGSLVRWAPTARVALGLHVVISIVALVFLGLAVLSDEPLTGAKLGELLAKFGVHATFSWIWSRQALKRVVSRVE